MKLPKIETLILLAFLGCVALWAVSKCSAKRSDLTRRFNELTDDEREERPARKDSLVQPPPAQQPSAQQPAATQKASPAPGSSPATSTAPGGTAPATPQPRPAVSRQPGNDLTKQPGSAAPTQSATTKGSTLFATIEGLKVRKEPGLKGETIATLKLYEPVTFLNQKTEWTQEISLGYEKVTDHWVKVRTQSGKDGWVFGAGVHYYKMKRKGVMD